jgi:hypothetical protein
MRELKLTDCGSPGDTQSGAWIGRVCRLLCHPRLPIFAALIAMLLVFPSLRVGWLFDDDFHRLTIRGSTRCSVFSGSIWDLFRFLDGNPGRTLELMDYGGLPWWTVPEAKGSFWRPLTILTHWIDYRLWPDLAWPMHVQSILWYGLLVLATAALYRRMMGAGIAAGLAAFLFAVDDAHSMPATWLSNRNAIVSGVCGVLAILAHDRWRRQGRTASALPAWLCAAASLLSAEAGVGTFAYLAAHAVYLDPGKWRRKTLVMLPYLIILIAWRAAWALGGHGVQHLGLYVDPIREPAVFALSAIQRIPLLMLGQWAAPPAEASILVTNQVMLLLQILGVALTVVLAVAVWSLLRGDPVARFWTLGMALSLVPVCATFPANRLLVFAGIGAMGLLAQFLSHVLRLENQSGAPGRVSVGAVADKPLPAPHRNGLSHDRRLCRVLAWSFVCLHIVLAPVALGVQAAFPMGFKRFNDELTVRTAFDSSVEQQDLIIVNAPSVMHATYLTVQRELAGQPIPTHTRVLAPALPAVVIRRLDERTLSIRPENSFIAWRFDHLFRSERRPMSVGQQVKLTGLTVEVAELTSDLRPAEALFHFAVPLEHPSLRWLHWEDGEFIPFTPPPMGETVELRPRLPSIW